MMDLYRSTNNVPLPLHAGDSHKASLVPARVYALVASRLPDGNGRQRPILSLRRHLPSQAPTQCSSAGAHAQQPPRPFVLRACLGERIQVQVTNLLADTSLFLALVDDDYGIMEDCEVSALAHGETQTYVWNCRHAGVYPMYNLLCPDPVERRSLLGVLIVEP
jgi:hypothetical protein